jgi:hypothetical protein
MQRAHPEVVNWHAVRCDTHFVIFLGQTIIINIFLPRRFIAVHAYSQIIPMYHTESPALMSPVSDV